MDLEFGAAVDPTAEDPSWATRLAVVADRAGLDLLGVQDHPYQARFLDTWTLLATLAPQTTRIRLFPDVANLPLRPPAVLAKAAASLDLLSGGRCELGLGAGGLWDAIAAMGGPRREPGAAVGALAEAIDVIRLMWSGEGPARYDGVHYRLAGAHPGPRPAHDIGIWLGALGPRMLRLVGQAADGWIPSSPYVPPEQLPDRQAVIDDAARQAGRDPGSIRRIYNVMGRIGEQRSGPFVGPVAQWIDELTRLSVDVGMTAYVYWPEDDHARQLELFAAEVAPAVREAVATSQGTGASRSR